MLFHLHWLSFAVVKRRILLSSNSMSSLEAISGLKLEIDIVQHIIKDYTHLANSGKTIILCWIPSYVTCNIRGNERADTAAKSAVVSLPVTNMKLPARELLPSCQSCGIPLTVKHILVECANLQDIREKYFTVYCLLSQTCLKALTIIL